MGLARPFTQHTMSNILRLSRQYAQWERTQATAATTWHGTAQLHGEGDMLVVAAEHGLEEGPPRAQQQDHREERDALVLGLWLSLAGKRARACGRGGGGGVCH
eukprot:gene6803-biopygen14988